MEGATSGGGGSEKPTTPRQARCFSFSSRLSEKWVNLPYATAITRIPEAANFSFSASSFLRDSPPSLQRERIPSTAPLAAITSSPEEFFQTWDMYFPLRSNG